MLIKDVTLSKFPKGERRAALFDAKQTTEDPLDFLDTLTKLTGSTDWTKLTPETAVCYFFTQGLKCNTSKQICIKFFKEGEKDLNKLRDELKKSKRETPVSQVCGKFPMLRLKETLC